VSSDKGKVLSPRGAVVTDTGAYRVTFELAPERNDGVELRLQLVSKNQPWSETWLYRWSR
jgi:glucan biosynthesis protein